MEISEKNILSKTHYGLDIYAYVLHQFYPEEIVISLSGKKCKPARNPFLEGNKTLNIYNQDWVFLFEDTSDPNFRGNPFDFASRYYKLTGKELLSKLNEDLYLNIGKKRNFYNRNKENFPKAEKKKKSKPIIPKFSFYKRPVKNTVHEKEINLVEIYNLVKSESYKSNTEYLRGISDKAKARIYKAQNFDYVTFSGIFSKRSDKALLKHSGLLTIDFDHIPDIEKLKQALLRDEYFETEIMFVSPSGDGLKWVIPIDLTEGSHEFFFRAIAAYIRQTYSIEVDNSGKDISRAYFLPYDKELYINPKYLNNLSESYGPDSVVRLT
jgi:hypothetical protein